MMYLNHYEFERKLEINSNKINVLVVENNTKFFCYCKEILSQQNGDYGNFVLFDDKKEYSIPKHIKVIFDFYNLDLNEKKMQTILYNSLTTISQNELMVEYSKLNTELASFIDKLNYSSDFEIDYNDQSPLSALLKALGVVAKIDTDNLLSSLVSYIEFCSKLIGIKLFVFVNLKTFLSEDDIEKLYKQTMLGDIYVLLLENTLRTKLNNEFITLIDKDLCEIIV